MVETRWLAKTDIGQPGSDISHCPGQVLAHVGHVSFSKCKPDRTGKKYPDLKLSKWSSEVPKNQGCTSLNSQNGFFTPKFFIKGFSISSTTVWTGNPIAPNALQCMYFSCVWALPYQVNWNVNNGLKVVNTLCWYGDLRYIFIIFSWKFKVPTPNSWLLYIFSPSNEIALLFITRK